MKNSFSSQDSWRLLDAALESRGLFLFKFPTYKAVFRRLSVSEIESIHRLHTNLNETFIEDWILQRTIVACSKGKDYISHKIKAGHVKQIAEQIMLKSSVTEDGELLEFIENEREQAGSTKNIVEGLILAHFPSIDIYTLRGYSLKEQLSLVCKAEKVMDRQLLSTPEKNKLSTQPSSDLDWLLSEEAADIPDFDNDPY